MNIQPNAQKVLTALALALLFSLMKSLLITLLVFIAAYGIWSFLEK